MKDFGAPAQGIGKAFGANGHGHELLEVYVVIGMGPAVDDVHHRHWKDIGVHSPEVAVQWHLQFVGCRASTCHGNGEDRVGAELAFVGSAVELHHGAIDQALLGWIHAAQSRSDCGLNVLNRFEHAFAKIMPRIVVAQLNRLVLSS